MDGKANFLIAITLAAIILGACSSPSSPVEGALVDSPALAEPVPMDEPAMADSVPSSPPSTDHDACLQREWWMNTHDVDILLATIAPVPNMHVSDGYLIMTFSDGEYEYEGMVVLHLDLRPGRYIETTASFVSFGPYSTHDNSTLNLDLSTALSEILEMRAYKDGTSVVVPPGSPSVSIMPPASAPYRCTTDRLEIDSQGPYGIATMFFYP